jgi:hypothetical protein
MVISLFRLFAPFCWLSVALSSDSDVPAEAAGMGDMDTLSRRTLLVIFTRVGGSRDRQTRRMNGEVVKTAMKVNEGALMRYSEAIFARPSPDNQPSRTPPQSLEIILVEPVYCVQGKFQRRPFRVLPARKPPRLSSFPAFGTHGDPRRHLGPSVQCWATKQGRMANNRARVCFGLDLPRERGVVYLFLSLDFTFLSSRSSHLFLS